MSDHIVYEKMKFRAKGLKRLFGSFKKKKVGFTFNMQAWLIAWSYWNVQPDEFDEFDQEKWSTSLMYGGAIEHAIVNQFKIFYTYNDIKEAAERLTYKQGKRIGTAIANSQTPKWYRKLAESEAKKKAVTK
jgi:hypothetical protein